MDMHVCICEADTYVYAHITWQSIIRHRYTVPTHSVNLAYVWSTSPRTCVTRCSEPTGRERSWSASVRMRIRYACMYMCRRYVVGVWKRTYQGRLGRMGIITRRAYRHTQHAARRTGSSPNRPKPPKH